MNRRVKEFIDISDFTALDDLIEKLVAIRDGLPESAEPELRLRGDDVFGRRLSISYMRERNDEETAVEDRYAEAIRIAQEHQLERLQQELGVVCHIAPGPRRRRAA